jgi:carboxyl-terminal processing protease
LPRERYSGLLASNDDCVTEPAGAAMKGLVAYSFVDQELQRTARCCIINKLPPSECINPKPTTQQRLAMKRRISVLVVLLLMASAQLLADAPKPAVRDPDLAERAWIASTAYHTIKRYFAHWEALPAEYDFDARYRDGLREALAASDRWTFSLAMTRLFASLQNGHTSFTDNYIQDQAGDMPFRALRIDGRWVVTRTALDGLEPGDVIHTVDGQPVEQWIAPIQAAVGQSDSFARDRLTWVSVHLFPRRFELGLEGNRRVSINLDTKTPGQTRGRIQSRESSAVRRPEGILVVRIPSFGAPEFEEAAIRAVRAAGNTRAILFDLRANGGGSTPTKLLEAIMTGPYRGTIVATPITVAVFDAHAVFAPEAHPLPKGMLRYGPRQIQPREGAWAGPIGILADGGCGSACEDFVVRFKDGKRGPVMGERTFGSTGQPYFVSFGEFGMGFRVSTKREYLPEGGQLEGAGVVPDIAIPLTVSELRTGNDMQLETAISVLLAQTRR